MKKKTLAGIAFCMGASPLASANSSVDLQALELLKENRISHEEYLKLTASPQGDGNWSNMSITDGSWSNMSITNANWSNMSITDGSWSNMSITNESWSNMSITGDLKRPENTGNVPAPAVANGIDN